MVSTKLMGLGIIKVDREFNLYIQDRKFTKQQMQEYAKEYKGLNRIHKPMLLLFWTDVMNGNKNNWNLI